MSSVLNCSMQRGRGFTRFQMALIRFGWRLPAFARHWYVRRVVMACVMPYAKLSRREAAWYYVRKYVLLRRVRRVNAYERARTLADWEKAKFGG